jgi:hypothetical protein
VLAIDENTAHFHPFKFFLIIVKINENCANAVPKQKHLVGMIFA